MVQDANALCRSLKLSAGKVINPYHRILGIANLRSCDTHVELYYLSELLPCRSCLVIIYRALRHI